MSDETTTENNADSPAAAVAGKTIRTRDIAKSADGASRLEVRATGKNPQGAEIETTVMLNLGQNIAEAIELFGEEVAFTLFLQAAKIAAQAAMRRLIEAGQSEQEVTNFMASWKPGAPAGARLVTPEASLARAMSGMSAEEKTAFLDSLRAKLLGE